MKQVIRRGKSARKRTVVRRPRPGPSGQIVRAPVAQGRVISSVGTNRVPSMGSRGRNCLIRHAERFDYVAGVGAGDFEAYKYSLNPGNINVFPWLAAIAGRFEKYKFHKLVFRYIPQCATTETGVVSLVFDFDPNDDGPTTMTNALSYHDYTTGPSWSSSTMSPDLVNGDRRPQLNTRPYNVGTTELANYDLGSLFICTEGQAGTAKVGYVEVEYEVEFFIHQLTLPVGGTQTFRDVLLADGITYQVADPTIVLSAVPLSDGETLPVHIDTVSKKFIFDQAWEGVVNVVVKAAGAAVLDSLSVTTNTTHKAAAGGGATGAANEFIYSLILKAAKWQYIAPFLLLSTLGSVDIGVTFASAPYDFLDPF